MPNGNDKEPKYLMCARALAFLSGLAVGGSGCGGSLGSPVANPDGQVYDGGPMGTVVYDGGPVGSRPLPPDADVHVYDGGPIGLVVNPDADPGDADSDLRTTPYDGGPIGLVINPDAGPGDAGSDTGATKYDGGPLGLVANPDARNG
jgi:hypothetical protein